MVYKKCSLDRRLSQMFTEKTVSTEFTHLKMDIVLNLELLNSCVTAIL